MLINSVYCLNGFLCMYGGCIMIQVFMIYFSSWFRWSELISLNYRNGRSCMSTIYNLYYIHVDWVKLTILFSYMEVWKGIKNLVYYFFLIATESVLFQRIIMFMRCKYINKNLPWNLFWLLISWLEQWNVSYTTVKAPYTPARLDKLICLW